MAFWSVTSPFFFYVILRRPPGSTLLPYTTLFRCETGRTECYTMAATNSSVKCVCGKTQKDRDKRRNIHGILECNISLLRPCPTSASLGHPRRKCGLKWEVRNGANRMLYDGRHEL